eukprot:6746862-Alexandrium_andersonii.AAC.1
MSRCTSPTLSVVVAATGPTARTTCIAHEPLWSHCAWTAFVVATFRRGLSARWARQFLWAC